MCSPVGQRDPASSTGRPLALIRLANAAAILEMGPANALRASFAQAGPKEVASAPHSGKTKGARPSLPHIIRPRPYGYIPPQGRRPPLVIDHLKRCKGNYPVFLSPAAMPLIFKRTP